MVGISSVSVRWSPVAPKRRWWNDTRLAVGALVSLALLLVVVWILKPVWKLVAWEAERYWVHWTTHPRIARENLDELEAEGERLLAALRAHRDRAGSYPAALDELRPALEGSEDWRYSRDEEGAIQLGVGEYHVHYFTLSWDSRTDSWDRDM